MRLFAEKEKNNKPKGEKECMKKLCVLFVFLFSLSFVLPAQVAEVQEELTKEFSTIKDELMNLKEVQQNIIDLSQSLKLKSEAIQTLSQDEQKQVQVRLIELSNELSELNRQYNDCYDTGQKYKAKYKLSLIFNFVFIGFFLICGILILVFKVLKK